jgi:hypothetical protein
VTGMRAIMKILAVALALLVPWAPSPAAAQAQGKNKAAAEALFAEGRRLMGEQRTADACSKFEASQELDAGIGTLLHLANCYEKLGRLASAWATFKEAASLATVRGDGERERIALTRAGALEHRLPKVTFVVPEAHRIAGLTVRIEGSVVPQGTWGTPLPIDPGQQRVEVRAPGRVAWSTSFQAARSNHKLVEVPLLERASSPPSRQVNARPIAARTDVAHDSGSVGGTQRAVGLVLGGVGVAGLAAGSVLGLQAQDKKEDSLKECPRDQNLCTSRGVELREEARDRARASNVAFAAGGSLLVGGVIIHLTSPKNPEVAKRRGVELSGSVTPSGGRLVVGGRF